MALPRYIKLETSNLFNWYTISGREKICSRINLAEFHVIHINIHERITYMINFQQQNIKVEDEKLWISASLTE